MTVNPVTSISTPKATVNRDSITKQKHQVSIGLNKSLTLNDIWQPVEFDWYLRWKEYVAFDTVGTDNRSDEVSVALLYRFFVATVASEVCVVFQLYVSVI